MKHGIAVLIFLLVLSAAGCVYDVPLADNEGLRIDPAFLGVWQGANAANQITISKHSDSEYRIHYSEGPNGTAYFVQGYAVRVEGLSLIQLRLTDDHYAPLTSGGYVVFSAKLTGDTLGVKLLDLPNGGSAKSRTELRSILLANKNQRDFDSRFKDVGTFKRLNTRQTGDENSEIEPRNATRNGDIAKMQSSAQTVLEFVSKNAQEQRSIIEGLISQGLQQLSSNLDNGVEKSKEKVQRDRRMSNLLRALFTTASKDTLPLGAKATEPIGFTKMKELAKYAMEKNPEQLIWNILVLYAQSEYEDYYTKSNGGWKNDFDSKTDAEQETKFRIDILNKEVNRLLNASKSRAESLRGEARNLNLHVASYKGDVVGVRALLNEGADVNFKDDKGDTALMLASIQGHLAVVQALLAKGAEVDLKDNDGNTALFLAAYKVPGSVLIVQTLLAKGADPNTRGKDGMTVLMQASAFSSLAVVQALLAKGADVNAKENKIGASALGYAAAAEKPLVVQALLAKGANVNAKTKNGETALTAVASNGNIVIVRALLSQGADVNAKTDSGNTALTLAASKGHVLVVQALLAKGADLNARDRQGHTAFMLASIKGHFPVVQALLTKRLDINERDDKGLTPLMMASQKGFLSIVKVLLTSGATVNAQSSTGFTALMFAASEGHLPIVQELLVKGANACLKADGRFTAGNFAEAKDFPAIAEILYKEMDRQCP